MEATAKNPLPERVRTYQRKAFEASEERRKVGRGLKSLVHKVIRITRTDPNLPGSIGPGAVLARRVGGNGGDREWSQPDIPINSPYHGVEDPGALVALVKSYKLTNGESPQVLLFVVVPGDHMEYRVDLRFCEIEVLAAFPAAE